MQRESFFNQCNALKHLTAMTINLIDILQKSFSEKSYEDISQHVGISTESTKNGLKVIIPNVLAAILGNNTMSSSTQAVWWNALDSEYPYSDDEFVQTENISNTSFLVKGREVLSGMFRKSHAELVSSVSSVAGIQKEKSAGLIEAAVPLIDGHLKNWMRRKNWKFKDLIENLIENKALITGALPKGISIANFGKDNIPIYNCSKTIETVIPSTGKPKKKMTNGLVWFSGLVILALVLWYFMGTKSCARSLDTDDLLIPDMTQVIDSPKLYEKPMDGTYYAYEMKPEVLLKTK